LVHDELSNTESPLVIPIEAQLVELLIPGSSYLTHTSLMVRVLLLALLLLMCHDCSPTAHNSQ